MTADDIKVLGMTDGGKIILGGFFTAHDTHGYHCDWFLPMFLNAGFAVSIPFFAAECLQHPTRDPDMIWPLLEVAHKESRLPFDLSEQKERLNFYLAYRWTGLGKPDLRELALTIMREGIENGRGYLGFAGEVKRAFEGAKKQ